MLWFLPPLTALASKACKSYLGSQIVLLLSQCKLPWSNAFFCCLQHLVLDFGAVCRSKHLPADISVEIDAMTRLLQARPGVIDLEDKLCHSLKNKLESILNIEASALAKIYDTARSANFPDGIRQEIFSTLVGMAVGEVLESQCVGKVVASSQDCKIFHKYPTAKDISALQSASMWEGCEILPSRLRLLGVEGMKESLKRLCCGILVWLEREKDSQASTP